LSACAAANTDAQTATQTVSRTPGGCFRTGEIINVNKVDDRTLYVATERGYVFRLDTPGGCYIDGASIVGAFTSNADTCNGSQARVTIGAALSTPSRVCIAQISGPYGDSRTTGLWSRTLAN
jgi:hypothetical protein